MNPSRKKNGLFTCVVHTTTMRKLKDFGVATDKTRGKWGGFPDAWKKGVGLSVMIGMSAIMAGTISFFIAFPILELLSLVWPKREFTADYSIEFWTVAMMVFWFPVFFANCVEMNHIDLSPMFRR